MKRFALAVWVIVFACAGLRAAEEFDVDNEGFIRDWLLLAPIGIAENSGAEEIDKQQVPDEAKLSPKAGDKVTVAGKELAWKKIKADDYYFDINKISGSQLENSAGYAVCYISAADDLKELKLMMGSNDQGKVYLNGKEVLKFTDTRTIDKDSDNAANMTLNKGVNTLVFKVINEVNNWQGCIRFVDKGGKAVKNIKVKLEK